MNTAQIKKSIHEYIDNADEQFLNLVFSMVEKKKSENGFSTPSNDEMLERAKHSMKSVKEGKTRNIHEFKEEVETWKKKRTTL